MKHILRLANYCKNTITADWVWFNVPLNTL